jgi:hypothetical protein
MALDEKLPLVLFGSEAAAVGAAVKDARVRLRAAAAAAALEKQRLARKTGAVNGTTTDKNGSTAPASVTDAEVSFFFFFFLEGFGAMLLFQSHQLIQHVRCCTHVPAVLQTAQGALLHATNDCFCSTHLTCWSTRACIIVERIAERCIQCAVCACSV